MSANLAKRRGVALYGGSFDPIHQGHLALITKVWESLPIAKLYLLPAGNPWQKAFVSSAEHRLEMLKLALKDWATDDISLITDELSSERPNYTVETLEQWRNKLGTSFPLSFVMGMDQWHNLETWYRWEELLDLANLVVITREQTTQGTLSARLTALLERCACPPESLLSKTHGGIVMLNMPKHPANASELRMSFALCGYTSTAQRYGHWLTPDVLQYIREHRLYQHR